MAESKSTKKLSEKVTELADRGLTVVHVMHVALNRRILLPQAHAHPIWKYTEGGGDNPTRAIRGGFFENKPMREMLYLMFKGKMTNFPNEVTNAGFTAEVLVVKVSIFLEVSQLPPCLII